MNGIVIISFLKYIYLYIVTILAHIPSNNLVRRKQLCFRRTRRFAGIPVQEVKFRVHASPRNCLLSLLSSGSFLNQHGFLFDKFIVMNYASTCVYRPCSQGDASFRRENQGCTILEFSMEQQENHGISKKIIFTQKQRVER